MVISGKVAHMLACLPARARSSLHRGIISGLIIGRPGRASITSLWVVACMRRSKEKKSSTGRIERQMSAQEKSSAQRCVCVCVCVCVCKDGKIARAWETGRRERREQKSHAFAKRDYLRAPEDVDA